MYLSVDVVNYSSETLDRLRLSIPSSVPPASIISSRPVRIEPVNDVAGIKSQTRVLVSGLESARLTRLLVPVADDAEAREVELLNGSAANIKTGPSSNVSNPKVAVLWLALLNAAMNAAACAAMLVWTDKGCKRLAAKIERVKEEFGEEEASFRRTIAAAEARADELGNTLTRVKLLLIARISDYAKELDFWRHTMARLVLGAGGEKRNLQTLNDLVTDSLRTFGTRDRTASDFNAIHVLAGMLQRAEVRKRLENDKSSESGSAPSPLDKIRGGSGDVTGPAPPVLAPLPKGRGRGTNRASSWPPRPEAGRACLSPEASLTDPI